MCTNESRHSNMLPVGTVLRGTYRIEKHLASGGFGNTYLAKNTAFDEVCAIKEFFIKGVCERDDDTCTVSVSNSENTLSFEQQRGKFKKEARRLRSIRNEHVVQVHDLFEENGTAYYVMDFVDGCSLSAQLKSMGKGLAEEMVWDYLRQVLDGLAAVHAAGIWHLDIKPGNIMLDKQGCVKLIDFGASKQSDAEGGVTTSSAICYTPGYAPSEQMAQSYDKFGPWTDFYALGATLYKLLTNQTPPLPTDLSEDETADKRATLPMPGVSEKMRSLVVWMMQVSRLKRPKDVAEIQRFMEGEVSQVDPGDEDTQVIMPTSDPKPHANPASEPSPKPDSGVAGGGPKQGKKKPWWLFCLFSPCSVWQDWATPFMKEITLRLRRINWIRPLLMLLLRQIPQRQKSRSRSLNPPWNLRVRHSQKVRRLMDVEVLTTMQRAISVCMQTNT